jgi:hypothetical protein
MLRRILTFAVFLFALTLLSAGFQNRPPANADAVLAPHRPIVSAVTFVVRDLLPRTASAQTLDTLHPRSASSPTSSTASTTAESDSVPAEAPTNRHVTAIAVGFVVGVIIVGIGSWQLSKRSNSGSSGASRNTT